MCARYFFLLKYQSLYQDSDFYRIRQGEVSESVVFKNKGS